LESDNRISSKFFAVERRHDLPSARSSLTESSLATNRSLLSPCSFFFSFARNFRASKCMALLGADVCTYSFSINHLWGRLRKYQHRQQ
jgi:hypothetical protein